MTREEKKVENEGKKLPLGCVSIGLWSADLNDSFRVPSEGNRLSSLKLVFSGLCATLLNFEERSIIFEVVDTSFLSSTENPTVDFIEGFQTKDGLLSGPFNTSSRLKGRLSFWEPSSAFLTGLHSEKGKPTIGFGDLLDLYSIEELCNVSVNDQNLFILVARKLNTCLLYLDNSFDCL